jgi:hypothetical protein
MNTPTRITAHYLVVVTVPAEITLGTLGPKVTFGFVQSDPEIEAFRLDPDVAERTIAEITGSYRRDVSHHDPDAPVTRLTMDEWCRLNEETGANSTPEASVASGQRTFPVPPERPEVR